MAFRAVIQAPQPPYNEIIGFPHPDDLNGVIIITIMSYFRVSFNLSCPAMYYMAQEPADQAINQGPSYTGWQVPRIAGREEKGTEYRSPKIESDILRTYVTHISQHPVGRQGISPATSVESNGGGRWEGGQSYRGSGARGLDLT